MGRKYIDYTGEIINNVLIKGVDPDSGGAGKHKRWLCVCPYCNKIFTAQSNHIKKKYYILVKNVILIMVLKIYQEKLLVIYM